MLFGIIYTAPRIKLAFIAPKVEINPKLYSFH